MSLHIPATVVPFTYAVTFPACQPLEFATRSEFIQWAAERRSDLTAPGARKGWAADLANLAEAEGFADGVTAYGDEYGVEAWQSTAYVGPADDARAHLATTYPAGTPVTAGDAMNRDVVYVGTVSRIDAAADVLVVAWVDGSTTEGAILDMARMLDTTDAATLARAERARDEAEAARITEAARRSVERADAERTAREADRLAYLASRPEHAANFGADTRATRYAVRTLGLHPFPGERTARVAPGWSPALDGHRDARQWLAALDVSEAAIGYALALVDGPRGDDAAILTVPDTATGVLVTIQRRDYRG